MHLQPNHVLHTIQIQRSVIICLVIQMLEHMEDPHLVTPRRGREPEIPAALINLIARGFHLLCQIVHIQ